MCNVFILMYLIKSKCIVGSGAVLFCFFSSHLVRMLDPIQTNNTGLALSKSDLIRVAFDVITFKFKEKWGPGVLAVAVGPRWIRVCCSISRITIGPGPR